MTSEQDKTLEAIKTAIQMEIDGKEYYLKASQASGNELGRKLLATLSKEEDSHRLKFESIFKAISSQHDWPATDVGPDSAKELKTIFARATEEMGKNVKAVATEIDTVNTAMQMEIKTRDFYREHAAAAKHETEKEFYEALTVIEQEHHLILLDYYEYLKDPSAWFAGKEHHSLDGG